MPSGDWHADIVRFECLPLAMPTPPLWCLHWLIFTSQSLDMSDIVRLHRPAASAAKYVFRQCGYTRLHCSARGFRLSNW